MKKVILLSVFWCLLFTGSLFAQSNSYFAAKRVVISDGYTIVEEKEAFIAKGDYLFSYRRFYEGVNYIIYADSDDSDVKDVDIFTYYYDGDIRDKDTTVDTNAAISFTPAATIDLKIVVLNYNSYDSVNKSKCRYFVAYK